MNWITDNIFEVIAAILAVYTAWLKYSNNKLEKSKLEIEQKLKGAEIELKDEENKNNSRSDEENRILKKES